MSLLKKRGIKPALIIVGGLAVLTAVIHFSGSNPVSAVLKTVFAPVQRGASYIAYKADDMRRFLWEMDAYKKQNEELTKRVNELELQNKSTEQYREENDKLQSLLDLQTDLKKYTSLAARVISYSSNNWYGTIEIDKGTMNGVAVGNSVITGDGVVGTVTEAGLNWATVSSILNTGSATGIRVTRTGSIGLVEGDGSLMHSGVCKLSFLDRNSNVIVGDLLETSGSSGVYPPGLMVGKVKDISSDNTGNLEYATVEPTVNFSDLYAVMVINGLK